MSYGAYYNEQKIKLHESFLKMNSPTEKQFVNDPVVLKICGEIADTLIEQGYEPYSIPWLAKIEYIEMSHWETLVKLGGVVE